MQHKVSNTRKNKRKIYCWLNNDDDDDDEDDAEDGDDSIQFNYSIVY